MKGDIQKKEFETIKNLIPTESKIKIGKTSKDVAQKFWVQELNIQTLGKSYLGLKD